MRPRRFGALVWLCLLVGSSARADDLGEARRLIDSLEYTEAIGVVEALIRRGESTEPELAAAYELLGRAAASSGEQAQAVWAYTRLLVLEPNFTMPSGVSPRLRRALEAARAELSENATIRLQQPRPREAWRDRPTSITLSVVEDGLGLVRGMRVYHRAAGADRYSRVTVRGPPPLEAIIPSLSTHHADRLEYFIGALDEYGNEIARVGSERRPLSVLIRDPPVDDSPPGGGPGTRDRGGIAGRWWFWTGMIAVAAAATVAVVLLAAEDPDCPAGQACYRVQVDE